MQASQGRLQHQDAAGKVYSMSPKYEDHVAEHDVKKYQLRSESGAGADVSMDSKIAAAIAASPPVETFHQSFSTMALFKADSFVESLTGAAAAQVCNSSSMHIQRNAMCTWSCASASRAPRARHSRCGFALH